MRKRNLKKFDCQTKFLLNMSDRYKIMGNVKCFVYYA